MLEKVNASVDSIEQLITNLEHVEESELKSDIRQNVRAEMKRIKRNVSSILAFTAQEKASAVDHPELNNALLELRRECISINGTISRFLILQSIHADRWIESSSRVMEQYAGIAEATRQMCALAAPLRVQELSSAL